MTETYTLSAGSTVLAALVRARTVLGDSLDIGDPVAAAALAGLDAAAHLVSAALHGPADAGPSSRVAELHEAVDAARATMLAARFALVRCTDTHRVSR